MQRSVCLLLLLLCIGISFGAQEAGVVRNEDVVRWFVAGTTEQELIERIASTDAEFQLDEDMLAELRIAGLPETVIQTMISRQQEMNPEPPEAQQDDTAPAPSVLVIRFNRDWKKKKSTSRPSLRLLDEIDPALIGPLELRETDRRFTDLALFVFCRTSDHVPDQWRSKSPLGRDFVLTPRHRMLQFEAGAERVPANKLREFVSRLGITPGARKGLPELGVLQLTLPESFSLPLTRDEAHDLTIGVAVQVGNRFFAVAQLERNAVILEEDEELAFDVKIRDGRGRDPRAIRLSFDAD